MKPVQLFVSIYVTLLTMYGEKKGQKEREIRHIKLRAKEYITSSVVNIPYAVSIVCYKIFNIRAEEALIFDSA